MKKLLMIALVLALAIAPALGSAETVKDETVYALLEATGAEKNVLVVSHIDTPEAGEYVDYGVYTSLQSMLTEDVPAIDGETITWTLEENAQGFYAVGEPEVAVLPVSVSIAYKLDGAAVEPAALAGQGGHVEMTLAVTPNANADEAYRTRYVTQVQVPLDLSMASNIEADGASATLVGQTNTLAYTILPGQEATYTIAFDAADFAMSSITIACAETDFGEMLGIDVAGLTGQTETMTEAARQLADGGAALSEGVGQLADGTQALADNMAAYAEGIDGALVGISQLVGGLQETATAGKTLAESAAGLNEAFAPLLEMVPEAQRAVLEGQLAAFVEGVSGYTQGVGQLAGQAGAMIEGTEESSAPLAALGEGTAQLLAGVEELNGGMQAMGPQVATLADGQKQLADGIDEAIASIGDMSALSADTSAETHSFVSPEHTVRSVQFVLMTEGIAAPQADDAPVAEAEQAGFFTRLADLFR